MPLTDPVALKKYKDGWYQKNRERLIAKAKARHSENREDALRYKREYYLENRAEHLAKCAEWARNNPKALRAIKSRWKDANAGQVSASTHRRRADERNIEGVFTAEDIKSIWERQGHKCAVPDCTHPISNQRRSKDYYNVDHIKALRNGGSNWPLNIQILCRYHNANKGISDEFAWAKKHGIQLKGETV